MRSPRIHTAAVILSAMCAWMLSAQAPPSFEVASVKPAAPVAGPFGMSLRGGPGTPDPGRIAYRNVTLKTVLGVAYDVQMDQIAGPAWLDSLHYDITATVPEGATREQFLVMLQNLIAQRFQLAFHRETKEFPVYQLLTAKNGAKLKPVEAGASEPVPSRGVAGSRGNLVDPSGFPLPPLHRTAQQPRDGVAHMAGNHITMQQLADFLRFPVSFEDGNATAGPANFTRVLDKTGLTGEYDVRLEYQWAGGPGSAASGAASVPSGAPSLFTALQQQLGLRLEKVKLPLDVLVIDRAERTPSEN